MITTRSLTVAILSLVLGAAPLCAQQATEPPEQDTKETQKSPPADEPGATPATPPQAANNNSPFDYRSSEEISEDLSVSFPVDI
ncbi:MAG: hypothetical protein DRR04_01275 [Gammaproteobacteria bacterium]|nr:MAG: hypothetical protein DRQ97_04440 [Gammaproteobacteria bacterium]RLA62006.1 MAG: hypothetical protein DRR04_01275 [Gammaproteobacteria bacterium]